jgi:hypothetical protein
MKIYEFVYKKFCEYGPWSKSIVQIQTLHEGIAPLFNVLFIEVARRQRSHSREKKNKKYQF